jgi:hypothetical protein
MCAQRHHSKLLLLITPSLDPAHPRTPQSASRVAILAAALPGQGVGLFTPEVRLFLLECVQQ